MFVQVLMGREQGDWMKGFTEAPGVRPSQVSHQEQHLQYYNYCNTGSYEGIGKHYSDWH
jgi:hypothetical protein